MASRAPTRHLLLEIFAVANLLFLGLDIVLAHSINAFAHPAEWVPVGFSAAAAALLVPGLLRRRDTDGSARALGFAVGAASIAVGIAGMLLHLESTFFTEQSLHNLVYTAPFAAPLAYTGVGFLLLLNRMEPPESEVWGPWVIFLALGGFVGVLAVSLGDHAQNGFFYPAEWIPVCASALAASFLLTELLRPGDRDFVRICLAVMGVQALVGGLGFALHLWPMLKAGALPTWDALIFGPPPFAPLLFANLALLAAIGLWENLARGR